ncbi:MAG: hypothetical protein L6R42_002093 [Xanthoria sp. 1 TBL-2021]|nr:MAG: hypothetical protein L6R42_002093 [Xanthoria sp. 1 TBL-2021]
MASSNGETYMLPRTIQESQRLDAQHEYMRHMSYGHLVHPSIPLHQLHAVADVATGTGRWLRQLAEDAVLPRPVSDQNPTFIGFDISNQQFPPQKELPPHLALETHDMVKPFPTEHHEKFDLVNVRLVSYAIKASDLDQVVRNVLQLLRPGGYLQWQEADASDSWAHPETPAASSCVDYVVAEKIDRGLLPSIAGPLVKTILSVPVTVPDGQQNIVSWSKNLMRLIHLETVSTFNHPSPAVEMGKKAATMSVATALLKARLHRKSTEAQDSLEPDPRVGKLKEEVEAMKATLEIIQRGEEHSTWDFDITWIVARKAIVQDTSKGWMTVRRPSP